MTTPRIAVIGAGITGLTCARALQAAGLTPTILDKGRGLGGRMATRRIGAGLAFDHGATQITASDPRFVQEVAEAGAAGALAAWDELGALDGRRCHVGLPGMSGLARHLGAGLEVRLETTVTALRPVAGAICVVTEKGEAEFDRVILTLPAPQVIRLVGADHAIAAPLSSVRMDPCLTLMTAFPAAAEAPFLLRDATSATDIFARIVLDSRKPGRDPRHDCFVAQAALPASLRHLEEDMADVTACLLPELCALIGRQPAEAVHAVTHRWRYARTAVPLGQDHLADATGRLLLGGDWCLGPLAEDGYRSGMALAATILSQG